MPAEDIYQPRVAPGGTAGLPQAGADAFGASVGEGLAQVGSAVGRIADAERDLKARSETLDAGVRAARARADIDIFADELKRSPGGTVDYAAKIAAKRTEMKDQVLKGIGDRRVAERQGAEWDEYDAENDVHAHAWEATATAAGQIAGLRDQKNVSAARVTANPAALDDELMGWRTSVLATSGTDEQKNNVVAEGAAELVGAHLDALPPAEAQTALGKYAGLLSPDEQRQWGDRIAGKLASQEAKAAGLARQAEAAEKEAIATTIVELNGGRAPIGAWEAVARRQEARGDTSAAAASRLREREIVASERYRGASPAERATRIATLAAKPERSAEEGAELRGLQGQQAYLDKQPAIERAAYQTGRSVAPLTDLNEATVAQRLNDVRAAQAAFGGVPDFFLPGEAEPIAEALHKGTSEDKLRVAMVLARAGPLAGRALDQVAGGDVTFRAAATLIGQPQGAVLARDALRGPEALKARPSLLTPAPPVDGAPVGPGWADVWRGVAPILSLMPKPEAAALMTNSQNYYLAHAYQQGLSNFDAAGARRAIEIMLGRRGGTGGIGQWNGKPFVLPRGMSQEDWDRRVARARPWAWTQAAVNGAADTDMPERFAADAQAATPVKVRDGAWALRERGGNTLIMAKNGKPFLFDPAKLPRDLIDQAPGAPELPRFGAH